MPKKSNSKQSVKTRRAIVDLLKRSGPTRAEDLAAEFGITGMAVRQHLYELQDELLVRYTEESRGVGRPAKLWQLTESADELFPDTHAELAVNLIESVRATFGAEGITKLIEKRQQQQQARYFAAMADCATLADRLQRLAELRTAEGYMAEVETSEDGILVLVEHHCPICAAASNCLQLCAAEQSAFQELLGDGVQIERTDHIIKGAVRCAYRCVPT